MNWLIIVWIGICPVCKTEYRQTENYQRGYWNARIDTTYKQQNLIGCSKCSNAFWVHPSKIYRVREWQTSGGADSTGRGWFYYSTTHRDTTEINP